MKALGHCVEIPGGRAAQGWEERWHDQAGCGDAEAQTLETRCEGSTGGRRKMRVLLWGS